MSGRRRVRSVVALLVMVMSTSCSSSSDHSTVAARYLAVAEIGNRALDRDFDGLEGRDHDDLAAARSDFRDAAATERRFDRSLLTISFPNAIGATARTLVQVNEARAALTARAARSTSLAQVHAFQTQLAAANGPVEDQVKLLRRQLGLPPPESS